MNEGSVFGWPYCFYDGKVNKMILAPEYGGDGTAIGRCAQSEAPVAGFPAHYAPVDLQFFTSTTLPAKYRSGAFIVMRGSWNRAPAPMAGYNVLCQPFEKCKPSGRYEAFADGFAGKTPLMSPSDAAARPMSRRRGPTASRSVPTARSSSPRASRARPGACSPAGSSLHAASASRSLSRLWTRCGFHGQARICRPLAQ